MGTEAAPLHSLIRLPLAECIDLFVSTFVSLSPTQPILVLAVEDGNL
jgi:hypothetical protein